MASDQKSLNGFQTPPSNRTENCPQGAVDSQANPAMSSTSATPPPNSLAPHVQVSFGSPSTITSPAPFNRAVSVPRGPPKSFSSQLNAVSWSTQDIADVRNELRKALPFYKNIYATLEVQPEVLSRLDVLQHLGVNIHHPHIARPGGLGSLLGIWNELAGYSNKQIRDLKNKNASLNHEISNLKRKVTDLEASDTKPDQEMAGTEKKETAKEPTRFDGSEPNKYVRYFNFMLWKRDITRAWSDKPDTFKTEKVKICYILFFLDGDAFWDIADAVEAIVNSDQSSDAWEFKTGEELLDHLTEKYGKRE
ncbi:hypothetical protein QC762_403595 [Podospora pseudocomata]|uniref:Uncharacterized protein n=1 Tax=Podospora pseudocomata TaxID=2093779 RepID=A0ABR0GFE4_9PEZI|nr:hypothetical protein QC762_403595 [Podospora pseudocomata]